jgi:hypothetical protein
MLRPQPRHRYLIVGGHCERELEVHPRQTTDLDLAKAGDGLASDERLLDQLALARVALARSRHGNRVRHCVPEQAAHLSEAHASTSVPCPTADDNEALLVMAM